MTPRLLFANGLAILGAVLFHCVGMGFVAMFSWSHRYLPPGVPAASQIGTFSYNTLRVLEQVVIPAIPAFLFVSGYFVAVAAGRSQSNMTWRLVASRVRNLAIPYLLWSFIVLGLRVLEGSSFSPGRVARMLLTGGANEVLYFVVFLTQFYLLSPFLVGWAKSGWKSLLLVAGALQLLVHLASYPGHDGQALAQGVLFVPKWFFLYRVLWFPLGVVIGLHQWIYKDFIVRHRKWWAPLAALLFVAAFIEWEFLFRRSGREWLPNLETPLDSLYSLALLFGVLVWTFPKNRVHEFVTSAGVKSFGIYLTHAIFVEYTARLIYHVAPWLLARPVALQLPLVVVGVGGALVLMAATAKSPLRRWYRALYG